MIVLPIGLQLNNPGNLEENGIPWDGLAAVQRHHRFATYDDPFHGMRAMARTLINYQRRHGLFTVDTMLGRYAEENKTDRLDPYDICVASKLGIHYKDDKVDIDKHLLPMMMEMVRVEQGMEPFSAKLYELAIASAKE